MDVWAWVHDRTDQLRELGQGRLADIVEEIPTAANEARHDAVEALVPEGLALARALKDAWLEVYLRHWLLQSRVLHRHDVSDGLHDAVEALDFAHNDNTKDCPQSVCTVQDICSAQGIVDGPGHVQERLSICEETLARIDPSWPCFGCISAEQASALVDGERWSELDAFCRTQVARADDASDVFALNHALARSLIRQERFAEARATIEGTAVFGRRGARARDQQIIEALLASATGDLDGAASMLPDLGSLESADVSGWTEVALALARQGALDNTAAMGRTLRDHTLTLRRHDARHVTAMMFVHGAELALLRGQPAIARLNIVDAEAARERVKRKDIVDRALDRVKQQLAAMTLEPVEPFDLDAPFDDQIDRADPETAIARLAAAYALVVDDDQAAAVAAELSGAYAAAGFGEQAEVVVKEARVRFPRQLDLLMTQLGLWRRRGDEAAIRALLTLPFPERRLVLIELALLDEDRGRFRAAATTIEPVTTTNVVDIDAATIHARLLRQADDHHAALSVIDKTIAAIGDRAMNSEARALQWERSLSATLVDDHVAARAAAAALGFTFDDGDGPIDEPIAWCRIRSVDDKGRTVERVGVRNGPVTARITARLDPKVPPVYGDIVVFVPAPVGESAGPPDDDGRPQRVYSYPALRVLKPGLARAFDLDGFHPGDTAVEALMAALGAQASISRHSGPGYRLPLLGGMPAHVVNDDDVDSEEAPTDVDPLTRPALYMALLVPDPTTPLAPLLEIVLAHLSTWPRPMTCRALLAAVHGADDPRLLKQQALAEALDL